MASLQCQKPVQQTACQKTTTATCHKTNNEHHSLADKMKEMTGKMFHHENHGQQSACHGSTAMHGNHVNHGQQTACHGSKTPQSACHGSTATHGGHANHSQHTAGHGSSGTATHCLPCDKKKEGSLMHKIGDKLKTMRKKKNRDGHCRDGNDSSDSSSSDESDNENCGRNKRESC